MNVKSKMTSLPCLLNHGSHCLMKLASYAKILHKFDTIFNRSIKIREVDLYFTYSLDNFKIHQNL